MMNNFFLLAFLCLSLCISAYEYPETPKNPVEDDYHGTKITDNYQWLENAEDPEVKVWIEAQEKVTCSYLVNIQQIGQLREKLENLMRYDDESLPEKTLNSTRIFYTIQKKGLEHPMLYTKSEKGASGKLLIDPNKWEKGAVLHYWKPSRDGKYLAFGKSMKGDESPVLYIMDTESGDILPDTLNGWRQRISDWLPDSTGFYYIANPKKGEVPENEEYYWQAVYLHNLGAPAERDRKVWFSEESKEMFHYIYFSEDGKWEIRIKRVFYGNEVYIKPAGSDIDPVPVVKGFDAQYDCNIYDDILYIHTDYNAPNKMVLKADPETPQRKNWSVFIPETDSLMADFAGIGGIFFASYINDGYTKITAYKPDGNFFKDITLPSIGTAHISGWWKKDETRISFSSFAVPEAVYLLDLENNALSMIKKPVNSALTDGIITRIVHYRSKDGTNIPMFLIHKEGMLKNGNNPVLLSGYGGFNICVRPRFKNIYNVLLESGILIALPMLRGGGDLGKEWHEAGMFEKKQNVFDDFISAAEWLIEKKYTNPQRIAIQGGSNGGLLMGAVTVQRPELFRAVLCQVPLLDMLRYHKFDYANIWAREYGSSDNPDQFKYLLKYSPYHNIKDKTAYPAILFSASENDARTAPFHAMKMAAAIQEANISENPVLLLINEDSGHTGGTTIDSNIRQTADEYGFLLYNLGVEIR